MINEYTITKLTDRIAKLEREINNGGGGGGVTDHGALSGLGDNDHPQYRLAATAIDHGALSGLADDDHPQYLSKERGGWLEIPDGSWTYASATTITVPSGAASIYAVGDQVRLKQGGAYKYYYVVAVADTLLTVTGGSSYTVANAAITDAAFSKGGGVGHPGKFSYTPTWTAPTTNPAIGNGSIEARFYLVGNFITINIGINMGSTTTYGNGIWYLTLPFTAYTGAVRYNGTWGAYDNAPGTYYSGMVQILPGETQVFVYYRSDDTNLFIYSTSPFTWAGDDALYISVTYEI